MSSAEVGHAHASMEAVNKSRLRVSTEEVIQLKRSGSLAVEGIVSRKTYSMEIIKFN